ncbi:MAG: ATP-binding protein [Anaerolineales bacterium]|jgi:predicted AAA+ superfamily ATPase|nr:ATP-binding protein [Anaerolineales bacterium]
MGEFLSRTIQTSIEKALYKKRAMVIYGARQVGKTTLLKNLMARQPANTLYLNCDEPDIRERLTNATSTQLNSLFAGATLICIDEAQRVRNIGITLKLAVDNFPDRQIIATGSSSFDLSNQIVEPLTGRKYEFYLHPFSLQELQQLYSPLELERLLPQRMIFGMYPEITLDEPEAQNKIKEIARSYLYKDVFEHQQVKNPDILEKLLQALALQIGSEVSFNELANLLKIDKKTVERYIELLEKTFVIFRLKPFSRKLRNELTKLRKVYFWDTGVRNALINNFNAIDLRADTGALWENFMLGERFKRNQNLGLEWNAHFWRTHQGQEIDYVEEREGGELSAFEFKWQRESAKPPAAFSTAYPDSSYKLINKFNFMEFAG